MHVVVVVPVHVGEELELELGLGMPHAVARQLGVDGVGEALSTRVVEVLMPSRLHAALRARCHRRRLRSFWEGAERRCGSKGVSQVHDLGDLSPHAA